MCRRLLIANVGWYLTSQIAKFMGPNMGPIWSCRPQMGPMLDPWTLLSGIMPCTDISIRMFDVWLIVMLFVAIIDPIYIIEIVTKISIIEYLNLSCVLHYWGWIAFSYQMQIIWIKTTAFISYDKWEKANFPKPKRRRKNTFLRSNLDNQLNSLDR